MGSSQKLTCTRIKGLELKRRGDHGMLQKQRTSHSSKAKAVGSFRNLEEEREKIWAPRLDGRNQAKNTEELEVLILALMYLINVGRNAMSSHCMKRSPSKRQIQKRIHPANGINAIKPCATHEPGTPRLKPRMRPFKRKTPWGTLLLHKEKLRRQWIPNWSPSISSPGWGQDREGEGCVGKETCGLRQDRERGGRGKERKRRDSNGVGKEDKRIKCDCGN